MGNTGKDILGIALVGCGRAGMIHGRNFASGVPGARVCAVSDADAAAAGRAKEELGAEFATADYRQLLDYPGVDAVVVVTPTKYHHGIVLDAARAGKHILCEKPMAMTAGECGEMISCAEKNGVNLQIGFMRRFDAGFRRAKEILDSGAIGDVVMVKSHTRGPSSPREWMFDIAKSNGPLAEVCSHDIDTLRWLTGAEARSLYAVAGNYRCPQALEKWPDFYDTVLMSVTMDNRTIGCIEGAQGVQYGYDAGVDVLGTKGCIRIGGLQDKSVLTYTKESGMAGDIVASWTSLFRDAYIAEDISFAEAVRQGTPPEVTGRDGLMAVEMVRAGNESIRAGKIVEL